MVNTAIQKAAVNQYGNEDFISSHSSLASLRSM